MRIMKRLLISLLIAFVALPAISQDSLLIYKKDGTKVPFVLAEVDSIKFVKKPNVQVNSISLNRTAIGLLQGNTYTLQAEVDFKGDVSPIIEWSSSDNTIATVDSKGNVSPQKAGSVTITATSHGKQAQCAITVVANGESVYRHGYSELNESDKAIYNYILKQILAFESNATTYSDINHRVYLDFASQGMSVDQNKVMKLTNLIIKDVPEAYVLVNYIYRYDYSKYQYYLRVIISYTPEKYAEEMAQIYEACNTITASVTPTTSEFDKAKIIHDGFIDWADYGGVSNANCGNITGSFITKKAVCEGFSRAYLMLCQRVGLKCVYVTGSMMTSLTNETWGNHAWNVTEVDDLWYMVDITGDGGFPGLCGHSNFLIGTNTYSSNYKYESTGGANENTDSVGYTSLPTISATDYDWAERP